MSSPLYWKSNHCSQCSTRFYRIWPLLHLWLILFCPFVMGTLACLLFINHVSLLPLQHLLHLLFSLLKRLLPSSHLLNFFKFCLYIIFSVSPSQLPYLIIQSTPSFESNTLYFLFLVYFFSKAFVCLLLCLLPAGMNLFCFLVDMMLDT